MRLNKRYQGGGKQQPQQPQRDTIRKVLRLNVNPFQDEGYTDQQRAEYREYFDENFPFIDPIDEYFSQQPEQQPAPAPAPQPQRPAATGLRRMFPLPPPQNQIIATDDRQLQEMLFDERKKGREAVRIMKADKDMRTGASPDYDVYWDEKKKQWKTRPIPQEEVNMYRKENRIFVTPRISF
jgi:hypothetical protein